MATELRTPATIIERLMDENHKTINIKGLGTVAEAIAFAVIIFSLSSCVKSCIHDESVTRQLEIKTEAASHK